MPEDELTPDDEGNEEEEGYALAEDEDILPDDDEDTDTDWDEEIENILSGEDEADVLDYDDIESFENALTDLEQSVDEEEEESGEDDDINEIVRLLGDPDELPTEEDIELSEDRELLDDILGGDPNDPTEDDENTPEITDDAVTTAMYAHSQWSKYLEQAEEDGNPVDDRFANVLARHFKGDSSFVSERNLYSMDDMVEYISSLEGKTDDNAVVVPDPEDEEGMLKFTREYFEIPEKADDYPEDIFAKTYVEEMDAKDEIMSGMREYMLNMGLNADQARMFVEFQDSERQAFLEKQEGEDREYKKENKSILASRYGQDFPEIAKEVKTFLSKYGEKFAKEFKGSKIMSSATLFNMIYDAMTDKQTPMGIKLNTFSTRINAWSDEKLEKQLDLLLKEKYNDDKHLTSKNADIRKRAKTLRLAEKSIEKELTNRGLL